MIKNYIVIIVPFIKGGRHFMVVKSGIPEDTFNLLEGGSDNEILCMFNCAYGNFIRSHIRQGKNIRVIFARPTGEYWHLVQEKIRQQSLKGKLGFYADFELEQFSDSVRELCEQAIIPTP
jgi:hypothetical protein